MFNRFESLKIAIENKSMEIDTLALMIDFYQMKGALTDKEVSELLGLLYPVEIIEEVEAV